MALRSPAKRLIDFKTVDEFEAYAKRYAWPGLRHYKPLAVLERFVDDNDLIVQQTSVVDHKESSIRFTLRITELQDAENVRAVIRETEILQKVGFHKHIMGLFSVFRHRQYAVFLFPDYSSLRDRLDVRHRFKTGDAKSAQFHEDRAYGWDDALGPVREAQWMKQPGIFDRNAVAFILRKVIKGLNYLHSKGYVHTQLAATNVYMDASCRVKIGGFLHCRRRGSKTWEFSGDANRHPPEAFCESKGELHVQRSFDAWSLGLLTLELITGLRSRHSSKTMKNLASDYLNGQRPVPCLAELEPNSIVHGQQIYDGDVDSFVASLLDVEPQRRAEIDDLPKHPFLAKPIDKAQARRDWHMSTPTASHFDEQGARNLYIEAFTSQGSATDLNPDFLMRVVRSIHLVDQDFYPVFKHVEEDKLLKKYIGIEASLARPYDDNDWSRDVLDVSNASSQGFLDDYRKDTSRIRTPGKPTGTLPYDNIHTNRHAPAGDEQKSYQRYENIFFVQKAWSDEERQMFVTLQFARWMRRGILTFPDVLRVSDEIEEVFSDYVLSDRRIAKNKDALPDSIYFASALRDVFLNPSIHADKDTRRLHHIYVDVALQSHANRLKKEKMDNYAREDPVQPPAGTTFLMASVTFNEIDIRQLEIVEEQVLGQQRVAAWTVDEQQRQDDSLHPYTQICQLLYERRRNPNNLVSSDNEGDDSNEARQAKIWGAYDRDYLLKECKWATPYVLDEGTARGLYSNSSEQTLDKQLLRTRIKQEEDTIRPLKDFDDVEARRAAVNRGQELADRQRLLDQALGYGWANDAQYSPAPKQSNKLRRYPKNR
ncbi:serine threonine protein kinase [Aphelenchoides avenae]|nr:serine threonine protein kinase [Aphelenchus avenae]